MNIGWSKTMKNKMNSKTVVNKKSWLERSLIHGINNLAEKLEAFTARMKKKIKDKKSNKEKQSFNNGYTWAMEELKKGNEKLVDAMVYNPFNRTAQNRPFDQGIIKAMREFNGVG